MTIREIKNTVIVREIENKDVVKDITDRVNRKQFDESVKRIVEHHHAQECDDPEIRPRQDHGQQSDLESSLQEEQPSAPQKGTQYDDPVTKPREEHFFCEHCQKALLARVPTQKELNPFSVIVDDTEYVVGEAEVYEGGESTASEYGDSGSQY